MSEIEWLASSDPARMLSLIDTVWPGMSKGAKDRKLRLFAAAMWRGHPGILRQYEAEEVPDIAERYADGLATEDEVSRSRHALDLHWGGLPCSAYVAQASRHLYGFLLPGPQCVPEKKRQAGLLREIVGNPWRPMASLPRDLGVVLKRGARNYRQENILPTEYLTPTVLSLAEAAYEERPGRRCERCVSGWISCVSAGIKCPDCHGTGRIEDGSLDPLRLAILADAIEEAGCADQRCKDCNGSGTYSVQATNAGLSRANGYGASTTYTEWRGCRSCGGDYDRKGAGTVPDPLLAHLRSLGVTHVRGCWALDIILGKE